MSYEISIFLFSILFTMLYVLAVMSSSRSDHVTQLVCPFICPLVNPFVCPPVYPSIRSYVFLYFEPFLVKKEVSRGSTSHVSSELIFMFLESGEHVEWGQLAS